MLSPRLPVGDLVAAFVPSPTPGLLPSLPGAIRRQEEQSKEASPSSADGAFPEADAVAESAIDLLLERLFEMLRSFVGHLPNILLATLLVAATWALAWVVRTAYWKLVDHRHLRRSLKELIIKLLSIATWIVGLLAASIVLFPSVDPESILAGLGLSSIAIGFAFKDVVENFFAGFLLLVRQSIEIGDFIECNGTEGRVEDVSIRDTYIRQPDGQLVIVPNAALFKNPVYIRTDRDIRRVTIICGIAYGEDVDRAREVIRGCVEELESVRSDQPTQVFAREFNSSSIDFEVTWWTGSQQVEIRRSRDEVVAAIKRALDDAGIEIPFPYRTLTFKGTVPIRTDED